MDKDFLSEAVLNYCIMAARKAVGDSGHRQGVIKTVRGRGYCLVAVLEARVADAPGSRGAVAREALIHIKSQPQAPDGRAAGVGRWPEDGSKRLDDRKAVLQQEDA
jgi:DNA-binding winged helix-turn-helix (wHTH) protein